MVLDVSRYSLLRNVVKQELLLRRSRSYDVVLNSRWAWWVLTMAITDVEIGVRLLIVCFIVIPHPEMHVGQYFPNIGETISNSDLNTSHYLYNVFTRWHRRMWFKRCWLWEDRIGEGIESCKIVFWWGTSFSLLLWNVPFSYSTLRHRETLHTSVLIAAKWCLLDYFGDRAQIWGAGGTCLVMFIMHEMPWMWSFNLCHCFQDQRVPQDKEE